MNWDFFGVGIGNDLSHYAGIANAQGAHMARNQNLNNMQNQLWALYNQQFIDRGYSVIQPMPVEAKPLGDCEGCGAPMKRYRSCCEHCRRVA